ncbi:Signal peptide peptidase SppA (protease 4) [hydrothermal vent metagenome]|uniref:Signal peptide peptidase SppA (Protease 4) n=1 Tax=hydrothermal vent metagenome TaxID=652676 RepID=A0A3B1BGG2_9ZZZZ
MKQFLKYFFASVLGTISGIILLMVLSFFLLMGLVAMVDTDEVVTISPNTILKLELKHELPERSYFNPLGLQDIISSNIGKKIGLNDVIKNIKKAKEDDNIPGIFLDLDDINAGTWSILEPIRNSLLEFKQSGKFIIAHGNSISQKAYYLGSVADSIFLTPTGDMDFKGLYAELTFFKKTLEKLDIEAQVIRVGKFKSAVEPFISEKMSDANRLQTRAFLTSENDYLLKKISEARKINVDKLKKLQDDLLVQSPEDAIKYKLVDNLKYRVDVDEYLKSLTGKNSDEKLKTVSLKKYMKVEGKEKPYTSDRIAVIYAVGEINSSKGDETTIGKENIIKAIRKARNNQHVKAIVMRVNSPGGSALISDIIWNEVELAKKEKPFLVSYSKYAASGGYYISCGADKIIAEPTTLTGSIGVFALIPNTRKFFDNKLGITFDKVMTGKYSDFVSGLRRLTNYEKQVLQKQVNRIYKQFVGNVAAGRNMDYSAVDKIGEGRIWSGLQAKEIGLVDELGGLDKTIEMAADMSDIDNYRVVEYPEIRDPFEMFFETLLDDTSQKIFGTELNSIIEHYSKALNLLKGSKIQARLPFEIDEF